MPHALQTNTIPDLTQQYTYSLLRTYAYYRALLGSLLLLMFTGNIATKVFGSEQPVLYFYTALSYTIITCLTLVWLWRHQENPSATQINTTLIIDIAAIVTLMSASGGVDSGLGYLLLVCVAVGGIFSSGQTSYAFAAGATVLVLAETLYQFYYQHGATKAFYTTGILGILLFLSNAVFCYLAEKILTSHTEATRQAQHAAHIQKTAQSIIERMRTGVIVIDGQDQIPLINQAALNLLGLDSAEQTTSNSDITVEQLPLIKERLTTWRQNINHRFKPLHISDTGIDARISFAQLERDQHSDVLVFLEDNRLISQEAQHLKLASLGRLTASIAHEIRNPLGAISHASQLLGESPDLPAGDKRLTEIIGNHSQRINQIIENTMNLSRRNSAQPEVINLTQWLKKFCEDYNQPKHATITINSNDETLCTRIDPGHLAQIMTNLMDNGLRYSYQATGKHTLTITVQEEQKRQLPYIEIIDDGIGMSEQQAAQIFEPFFTTETSGSGLGLYICRELCEANHASIQYRKSAEGKSVFKIVFSHAQKMF